MGISEKKILTLLQRVAMQYSEGISNILRAWNFFWTSEPESMTHLKVT